MTTSSINKTLARGLAKKWHRELRLEVATDLHEALIAAEQGRQRRSSIYRRRREAVQSTCGKVMAFEDVTADDCTWVLLLPCPARVGLKIARALLKRKKPKEHVALTYNGHFTWHAIERVHQRLNTTEWEAIRRELAYPALLAVMMTLSPNADAGNVSEIPSPGGLFIAEHSAKDGMIMKTFIDKEKFTSQQQATWEAYSEEFDEDVKLLSSHALDGLTALLVEHKKIIE